MNTHKTKKFEVLLICDYKFSTAATIVDHITSFSEYSQHNVHVLSSLGDLPSELDLTKFHVIVIHYSICIVYDYFISVSAREQIRNFKGFKAVYIQDDYRWIYKTLATLDYMKIDAIFGLASQKIVNQVYIPEKIPTVRRRETVLAGYVTDKLINLPKKVYSERTIDVGYRARKLSPWIGVHGQQKWQIAERFMQDAPGYALACDISHREEDRIYNDNWFTFLSNCKSVLGTESGASLCDFTGEIQVNVETHLSQHPKATFDEIRDLYFRDDDCKIMMNVISPRCFEAAALGTLMILYEGEYSGVLKPYLHYVPLSLDHSNMSEVVEYIKDERKSSLIIEQAYNDVILNPEYNYRKMVKLFDDIVDEEMSRIFVNIGNPYTRDEFNDLVRRHELKKIIGSMLDEKLASINLRSNHDSQIQTQLTFSPKHRAAKLLLFLYRIKIIKQIYRVITKKIIIFNPILDKIKNRLLS
jgi:hypothetical protein